MRDNSLILIGAGGHARACIEVIEQEGALEIAGLIGTKEELEDECMGYQVIGTDSDLPNLVKKYKYALITVGQIKSAIIRQELFKQAYSIGFKFPAIISPTAYVSRHAELGDGSIVMHGAIVNAGSMIGRNCIINSKALIEHDTTVKDHCHISTGAILNGGTSIGPGTFVGSGSIIKHGITVGSNCLIGMGLSIRQDHSDNSRILSSKES